MAKKPKPAGSAVAYSYLRFSSPQQSKGDSIRRQTELRDAWLERNKASLDESLSLEDKGVSGFTGKHRENPDRHALAAFLELVRQGRVSRGSFLIVESLDRLSREHIRPALTLLLNLIDRGVRIVQLLPVEQVYDESVEPMQLMMAIMELSRGHSESRMKSERSGEAWGAKKGRAKDGVIVTRQVPAWVRVVGGKFELIPSAAAAVRRIYRMAIDGNGVTVITKRLNAGKVPPIGRADRWQRSYVAHILATRKVIGEYQPHKGSQRKDRKPDGPPVPNYYPAVITEDEWLAARVVLADRRKKPGRIGREVNLFAGLLRDARDGAALHKTDKGKKSGDVLANAHAADGLQGAKYVSFPLEIFEQAVLSLLREINPKEIVTGADSADRDMLTLSGRLADIEGRLEALKAKLVGTNDPLDILIDAARDLEASRKEAADELARARQEAASPVAEAWGFFPSLADAIASAENTNDARAKLRAAIRRIVSEIWCLFVPKGSVRVAAVQVWFKGGQHRDYLIVYRRRYTSRGNYRRERSWTARSFVAPGKKGEMDLRDRKQAAAVEKALAGLDVKNLE